MVATDDFSSHHARVRYFAWRPATTQNYHCTVKSYSSRRAVRDAGGRSISFHLMGYGRHKVVLLHGLGGDSTDWQSLPMIAALARSDITVGAIDLWGHSAADQPLGAAPKALADLATDVSAVVDSLGCNEFGVVGYSFGGVVAALVAAVDPRATWSILGGIGAATFDAERTTRLAARLEGALPAGDSVDETVEFARSRGRDLPALALLVRALPGSLDNIVLARARHRMIIGGDDDVSAARTLAEALGGLTLEVIPGDHVSVFLDATFVTASFEIAENQFEVARRRTAQHRPMLIVLAGPPGSGKSSLAGELAARLGAAVVSSDAVRPELFRDRTYSTAESSTAYDECITRALDALHGHDLVVFDATNLRK